MDAVMSSVDDKVCCETHPLQFLSIAYNSTKQRFSLEEFYLLLCWVPMLNIS